MTPRPIPWWEPLKHWVELNSMNGIRSQGTPSLSSVVTMGTFLSLPMRMTSCRSNLSVSLIFGLNGTNNHWILLVSESSTIATLLSSFKTRGPACFWPLETSILMMGWWSLTMAQKIGSEFSFFLIELTIFFSKIIASVQHLSPQTLRPGGKTLGEMQRTCQNQVPTSQIQSFGVLLHHQRRHQNLFGFRQIDFKFRIIQLPSSLYRPNFLTWRQSISTWCRGL